MSFYDTKTGVSQYVQLAKGYDGKELITILNRYVPPSKKVLELGSGPGKDLVLLQKKYAVTGSDSSQEFIAYNKQRKRLLLKLEATTILTTKKFDCVYSNKVLHHLTLNQLKKSFTRQHAVLKKNGIMFHSFWKGSKTYRMQGLLFNEHTVTSIASLLGKRWDILEIKSYKEFKDNDSLYLIARKK